MRRPFSFQRVTVGRRQAAVHDVVQMLPDAGLPAAIGVRNACQPPPGPPARAAAGAPLFGVAEPGPAVLPDILDFAGARAAVPRFGALRALAIGATSLVIRSCWPTLTAFCVMLFQRRTSVAVTP